MASGRVEVNGETVSGRVRPFLPGEWRWLVEHDGRIEEVTVLHEQVVLSEHRAIGFVRSGEGVVLFDEGLAVEIREEDAEIAAKLRAALRDGKLQYVLVKASDNPGPSYAGATIEHLKI